MSMHEALLYEKLPDIYVRCDVCQWRCCIAPEKAGVCKRYENRGGILYSLNYARASSMAADHVEKKPLYHFHPGTLCFSMGSWGCNFHCPGCQNWAIACATKLKMDAGMQEISPEAAIKLAQAYKCHGLSWTYNEPTMWLEYTRDVARLAYQAGLYTAYVTNGYLTPRSLDTLGPYLQAYRVDVKGFGAKTYNKLAKITDWHSVLESASRAKNKWGMHVEVVTNLIPTINDDDEQLRGIADWIVSDLSELTPWHITRFHPQYKMLDAPATPLETMERARDLGHRAGLRFVYLGNIRSHQGVDTVCYRCQNLIVRRDGFHAEVFGLNGSQCKFCGAELNIRL
ncbi:MAG: AmmeMemoRadiSam system radical SAM enzyme [Dehalococcoidia bacterium]|nr:AmmeMemoRadiSam system radical SAM enzyme [Dehalococcoidia bacterium]